MARPESSIDIQQHIKAIMAYLVDIDRLRSDVGAGRIISSLEQWTRDLNREQFFGVMTHEILKESDQNILTTAISRGNLELINYIVGRFPNLPNVQQYISNLRVPSDMKAAIFYRLSNPQFYIAPASQMPMPQAFPAPAHFAAVPVPVAAPAPAAYAFAPQFHAPGSAQAFHFPFMHTQMPRPQAVPARAAAPVMMRAPAPAAARAPAATSDAHVSRSLSRLLYRDPPRDTLEIKDLRDLFKQISKGRITENEIAQFLTSNRPWINGQIPKLEGLGVYNELRAMLLSYDLNNKEILHSINNETAETSLKDLYRKIKSVMFDRLSGGMSDEEMILIAGITVQESLEVCRQVAAHYKEIQPYFNYHRNFQLPRDASVPPAQDFSYMPINRTYSNPRIQAKLSEIKAIVDGVIADTKTPSLLLTKEHAANMAGKFKALPPAVASAEDWGGYSKHAPRRVVLSNATGGAAAAPLASSVARESELSQLLEVTENELKQIEGANVGAKRSRLDEPRGR